MSPHIHFVGPIREPVAHGLGRDGLRIGLRSRQSQQHVSRTGIDPRNICEAVSALPIEVRVTDW